MSVKTKRAILAGASPDTANLGVNALCYSACAVLKSYSPDLDMTILTHGEGFEKNGFSLDDSGDANLMAAKHTKRFYNAASFINIHLLKWLPLVGTTQKRIFSSADMLLDVSGGDSFTDLYGKWRFDAIVYPKKLAMVYKIPLILLPQTYGPFKDDVYKQEAIEYLRYASLAFARDKYSFQTLKELLGEHFDSNKHLLAVDMAFLLPATPLDSLAAKGILPEKADDSEIFGINVSGLIYNDPEKALNNYGIKLDYKGLLKRIVEAILKRNDTCEIWLVPHVVTPKGHYESDEDACEKLVLELEPELRSRVKTITGKYDQCDIKGVISCCSWFLGTRMHATIAALSSGVPALGLAYSGKFHGVFESVGQESAVVDAREESENAAFEKIISSWNDREQTKLDLNNVLEPVKQKAQAQMQLISQYING